MSEPTVRSLSVVVPVRDEKENLRPLVEEICSVLRQVGLPFDVIVVDDGSTDGTPARIAEIREAHPELRDVRLETSVGQSGALLTGLRVARGEILVTMDGDLQNDPNDIPMMLERLHGADAVVGVRTVRHDSWIRKVSSRIAYRVRSSVVPADDFTDIGCALKAFRRECASAALPLDGMHRFLPLFLRMAGYRVEQVPVRHRSRRHGRTKYGVGNRLFRGFYDLVGVRWLGRRFLRLEARRHDTNR